MKKCPTCDKTFEDSMRFCQIDGTPLVDDAPAFDPFATIVGVAPPKAEVPEVQPEAPFTAQPEESGMIAEPEDVLDLPESDPLKTMYVSDEEMRSALDTASTSPSSSQIEIMPIEEAGEEPSATSQDAERSEEPKLEIGADGTQEPTSTPEPEPPSFSVPNVPAPNFGEMSPPPSPFSTGSAADIPVSPPSFQEASEEPRPFNEAETVIQPGYPNPFDIAPEPAKTLEPEPEWNPQPMSEPAPAPVEQWTPQPAPDANWENQQVGANATFEPQVIGAGGQNKTLPIVSLVLGILSLCCYVSPITGIAAVITGFMGMKNANNMPDVYGGKGLAIAGMVTGGIFLVIGLIYWIFLLFFGGMAMIMDAAR